MLLQLQFRPCHHICHGALCQKNTMIQTKKKYLVTPPSCIFESYFAHMLALMSIGGKHSVMCVQTQGARTPVRHERKCYQFPALATVLATMVLSLHWSHIRK